MPKYFGHSENMIVELEWRDIDLVNGGELTASEVVAAGALAIRVGATVSTVNPVAGVAIAAAGATAVLFGSFAAGI